MLGFGLHRVSRTPVPGHRAPFFYNLADLRIGFIDVVERYIQKIDARFSLSVGFDGVTRGCISINGAKPGDNHRLARILIFLLCANLRHCGVINVSVLLYTRIMFMYVRAGTPPPPPPPEKTDLESCHLYNIHNHIGISMAAEKTQIVIVSKSGSLSECIVETKNEATLDELTNILSKKCGNKKSDGFSCYHTYKYKNKKARTSSAVTASSVLYIDVWCKTDGRAGQENKYELPPPIDEIIIFGNIALVARIDKQTACDLSIVSWNKIYEKLFGGFEDLAATAQDDENEIDELAFVPASKKTANGYLKDGFVVDDSLGSGSAGSSDVELAVAGASGAAAAGAAPKKKRNAGGKNKNKTKTQKSDSTTTESEFVTETETETDSISDSEIRSDSSSASAPEPEPVPAVPAVPAPSNRKVKPSIKKVPVAKNQSTKKDEMKAAAAAAAAAVAAILDDGNDSELSEDSYSS